MDAALPFVHWTAAFALALVAGLAAVPLARLAGRGRIVDSEERDVFGRPMPRSGGIGIAAAWLVGVGICAGRSADLLVVLTLAAFTIGLHDDLTKSPPRARLAALAALALLAASAGFRVDAVSWGGAPVPLGAAAIPLSALWILGINVAFDFIDGLDGLAAGLAAIACLGLAVVGPPGAATLTAGALAGGCIAFLLFNRPPASVYMGDNGSNLLGFAVGCLVLASCREDGGALRLVPGLLFVAVPLLDTLLAVVRRAVSGPTLFTADREHVHHRLVATGRPPSHALGLLLGIAVICALAAIAWTTTPVAVVIAIAALGGLLRAVRPIGPASR